MGEKDNLDVHMKYEVHVTFSPQVSKSKVEGYIIIIMTIVMIYNRRHQERYSQHTCIHFVAIPF